MRHEYKFSEIMIQALNLRGYSDSNLAIVAEGKLEQEITFFKELCEARLRQMSHEAVWINKGSTIALYSRRATC